MSQCPRFVTIRPIQQQQLAPRPIAPGFVPCMQGTKRPINAIAPEATQQIKQQYIPRQTKQTFPPRGTGPRKMQSNTATSSRLNHTEEIDYNDIQSLRAYAIRTQQYQQSEEYVDEHNMEVQYENPQDADWDPDMDS